MPPVGFEPIISVGERPQTHTLDRAALLDDLEKGKNLLHLTGSEARVFQPVAFYAVPTPNTKLFYFRSIDHAQEALCLEQSVCML